MHWRTLLLVILNPTKILSYLSICFSYYASTAFPPRLAPPLKRQRLMQPTRSQQPKQQKLLPIINNSSVPDLSQLKVYSNPFIVLYIYTWPWYYRLFTVSLLTNLSIFQVTRIYWFAEIAERYIRISVNCSNTKGTTAKFVSPANVTPSTKHQVREA